MASPIDAWVVYGEITVPTLLSVQGSNPLLWIINTAPLFLGIFAGIAGIRQQRIETLAANQEKIIDDQTKDLRQALADAEEANKARTTFMANISEEINIPLKKVVSSIDQLTGGSLLAEQNAVVNEARKQSHSLSISLTNIIDFTKIEAGLMTLREQPLNISHCIEEAISLVEATTNQVSIHYMAADGGHESLMGDALRLRQIVTNLLNLSLRYTKQGEIHLSVASAQLDSRQSPNSDLRRWTITIEDTGIGLPTDRLERLFRPIDHINHSTHKYGEIGLGLAISKTLCEMMGGQMWGEYKGKRQGNRYVFTIVAKVAGAEDNGIDAGERNHRRDVSQLTNPGSIVSQKPKSAVSPSVVIQK